MKHIQSDFMPEPSFLSLVRRANLICLKTNMGKCVPAASALPWTGARNAARRCAKIALPGTKTDFVIPHHPMGPAGHYHFAVALGAPSPPNPLTGGHRSGGRVSAISGRLSATPHGSSFPTYRSLPAKNRTSKVKAQSQMNMPQQRMNVGYQGLNTMPEFGADRASLLLP